MPLLKIALARTTSPVPAIDRVSALLVFLVPRTTLPANVVRPVPLATKELVLEAVKFFLKLISPGFSRVLVAAIWLLLLKSRAPSEVRSVPPKNTNVPVPNALSLPAARLPSFRLRFLVRVFALLNVSVPAPVLVSVPAPETTPVMMVSALPVTVRLFPLWLMFPAKKRDPVPAVQVWTAPRVIALWIV